MEKSIGRLFSFSLLLKTDQRMQNEVIYVKYEELFQLKDFQKAKLLTGDNILLREITGAHVIEMADGVNWAGRGELVLQAVLDSMMLTTR